MQTNIRATIRLSKDDVTDILKLYLSQQGYDVASISFDVQEVSFYSCEWQAADLRGANIEIKASSVNLRRSVPDGLCAPSTR